MKVNHKITHEQKRMRRVRAKVRGTAERPRLHVHRSNKSMYLQVIDDSTGKTIAAAGPKETKAKAIKVEIAKQTAQVLADKLKKAKVTKLVFDRGSYKYHGRVRAVAEAMREQGLEL